MKKDHYFYDEISKMVFSVELKRDNQLCDFLNFLKNIRREKDAYLFEKISLEWIEENLANINHLIIEVTEKCNLACEYCPYSGRYKIYNDYRTHSLRTISWDTFEKGLNYYKNVIVSNEKRKRYEKELFFSFYGGEPLLEWDLVKKMVEYIEEEFKEKRDIIKFTLSTNGTLLKNDVLSFFAEKRNFGVGISFDGVRGKRIFRDGRDSFDLVLRNLERIFEKYSSLKERLYLLVTIHPEYNLDEVINFLDTVEKNWKLDMRISLVSRIYDYPKEILFNFTKKMDFLFKNYEEKLLNGNLERLTTFEKHFFLASFKQFLKNKQFFYHKPFGSSLCTPDSFRLFLSASGFFSICERVPTQFKIGSVEEGINFEKVLGIYKTFLSNLKCRFCVIKDLCNVCFATALKKNEIDKKVCKISKIHFSQNLNLYYKLLVKNPSIITKIMKELKGREER